MTMILSSVTRVRWADVPVSDRDDFRRRRAVDISSFYPAALKGSGVLSYPERAGGRAGGRADKPR